MLGHKPDPMARRAARVANRVKRRMATEVPALVDGRDAAAICAVLTDLLLKLTASGAERGSVRVFRQVHFTLSLS